MLTLLLPVLALVLGPDAGAATPPEREAAAPTRPDHVVVVVFENHSRSEVLDAGGYFRTLAAKGANLSASYAVTHPSQPNYLALYGGGTRGISNDSCPHRLKGNHLARQLTRNGLGFRAYSEGLPKAGSTVCRSGRYVRRHAPWVNYASFLQRQHVPFSRFPSDYTTLPTVSFVIPDLCHDMHNCSLATGGAWLKKQLGGYATWARTHNALLVVTFDEDDHDAGNNIYTVLVGEHVVPGEYAQRVDHYSVLRTIEDLYGLAPLRRAADATPISGIWG